MLVESLFVTMTTIVLAGGTPTPPCELGHYLHSGSRQCEACSQCKVNEIIREPCSLYKDTVCGPFYEFEFFNQGSSWSEGEDKDLNLFKLPTTRRPVSPRQQNDDVQPVGPSVKDETGRWKELCYGLITALVVLSLLFAAYVIVAHIQISRLRVQVKTSTQDSSEEETVYCYTHMLPSFCQRLRTAPKTSQSGRSRGLAQIYRPSGQARRAGSAVRASPNEYVLQVGQTSESQPGEVQQNLLPIIPEVGGAQQEEDHVRVLYTS